MNAVIEPSSGFSPKHPSGIDVIDDTWGGLYRGGSYLVYGQAMSGRGLLALMLARTGVLQDEKTLFISSDRQKDLFIQAASIGFDLRASHEAGKIRLMRMPTLAELDYDNDDSVTQALNDLVNIIVSFQPERVVMNDFMPFIAFQSFRRFQIEFIHFLERVDSLNCTIILAMPEPAIMQSRRVIEFIGLQMTGSIHIELAEENPRSTKRRISLIPHIGHIRHRVVDYWDLEDVVDDNSGTLQAIQDLEAASAVSMASLAEEPVSEPITEPVSEPITEPTAEPEKAPLDKPSEPDPVVLTVPKVPDLPGQNDRASFLRRLEARFEKRETKKEPFLLLAMRMDRGDEKAIRPFDFDFLMDLVQEALRSVDDILIDVDHERLVVCLANSRPEDAQSFFARLKSSLRKETPLQADHLLHSVSAIVVPDGRPFESAEEFLIYALDET